MNGLLRRLIFRARCSILPLKHEVPVVRTKPILTWMLLPLAFAAVSGCATHALWTEANLGTWHEPDSNFPMHLFRDGQSGELLVLYKESRDVVIRRLDRAYFLYQNEHRIDHVAGSCFALFPGKFGKSELLLDELPANPRILLP